MATTTIVAVERLNLDDSVYVVMTIEGKHGDSHMLSHEKYPSILFSGQRVAD